jgi:signal transduction histidine kinase
VRSDSVIGGNTQAYERARFINLMHLRWFDWCVGRGSLGERGVIPEDDGATAASRYLGGVNGRPTLWGRLRRVDPRVWDALIAAAVFATVQSDLWLERHADTSAHGPYLVAAAVLVAASAPLYWRRRRPLTSLVVVTAAGLAFAMLRYPASEPILALPLAVGSYSAAAYSERSSAQGLALLAAFVASAVLQSDANANWVEMAVNGLLTVGVPAALGRMVWNRRRRIEHERDLAARAAVAAERGRIARELHDVVAHSMSVMVVQAGAARSVLRHDLDEAERALSSIEESGRVGLAEMRRLLAADGEGSASLAPQPGLEHLDELLDRMRTTGLAVELVREGSPRSLPPGMDLSAYRIVQEALTNALKHGGDGTHARVLLRYEDQAIQVEVTDDGRGPPAAIDGSGRGLIGLRERVTLFGGELSSGARPGGGFVVHARIPLDNETST